MATMTLSEKWIEENIIQNRKRHTISARFNGAQFKILRMAAEHSRSPRSMSSIIRQAVMEYLCVNEGSIVPPELGFVDDGDKHVKASLRYRKLCRSVMTGKYLQMKGDFYGNNNSRL